MKDEYKTRRLVSGAFFVAIEILLSVTPLGYLPVGVLHVTTMHLPVILAGLTLGPGYGAAIGFVFGLSSMLRATFAPNLTSFCFSPFITVGGIQGNFASLLIAFIPRIFLGVCAGFLGKRKRSAWLTGFGAGLCTLLHTVFVMSLIGLFFGEPYTAVTKMRIDMILISALLSNGIAEIILAALTVPSILKALERTGKKYG